MELLVYTELKKINIKFHRVAAFGYDEVCWTCLIM